MHSEIPISIKVLPHIMIEAFLYFVSVMSQLFIHSLFASAFCLVLKGKLGMTMNNIKNHLQFAIIFNIQGNGSVNHSQRGQI